MARTEILEISEKKVCSYKQSNKPGPSIPKIKSKTDLELDNTQYTSYSLAPKRERASTNKADIKKNLTYSSGLKNLTDEETIIHTIPFLTLVLVSMLRDEDKEVIGFQKLFNLFQAYRFGIKEIILELTHQGCRPTLEVISCIEAMIENPVEENLRCFLFWYKHSRNDRRKKIKEVLECAKFLFGQKYILGLVIGLIIFFYLWHFVL